MLSYLEPHQVYLATGVLEFRDLWLLDYALLLYAMKYVIAFYLISAISCMCLAAENDTRSSESGYTSGSEVSDTSDEDDLPLGYSISLECLHCPACQQQAVEQNEALIVIVSVQSGAEAPYNSEITSVASSQHGTEAPYNSEITSVASSQHGIEAPHNSVATSVSSERREEEVFINNVITPAASEILSESLNPDEVSDQNHKCFCGCFSFMKKFFH